MLLTRLGRRAALCDAARVGRLGACWLEHRRTSSGGAPPPAEPPLPSVLVLGQTSLRGVSQVLFIDSPAVGAAFLGALAVADPMLALLGGAGAALATASAAAARLDATALSAGLHGYNGCLVGCAFSVFLPLAGVGTPSVLLATAAGAAASPFVALAIGSAMGRVPGWTLGFNAIGLAALLHARPFAGAAAAPALALADVAPLELALAPLVGISQIFVVDSALSGALVLGALAAVAPRHAGALLAGSATGALVGALAGADGAEIVHGLWGFNPALTALGVSVFFAPTRGSVVLALGGAASTAVLFGGLKTVVGVCGAPVLTLPFCAAMTACFVLEGKAAGLRLR